MMPFLLPGDAKNCPAVPSSNNQNKTSRHSPLLEDFLLVQTSPFSWLTTSSA